MSALSHEDAAIVRGWLQGLPAEVLIKTYFPSCPSPAGAYVRQLLDALALKASRVGHPAWVQWFQHRPRTESDQAKALAALEQLNRQQDVPPQPDHPIELWLPASLATACRKRGLCWLKELSTGGWQRLPPRAAALVRDWLSAQGLLPKAPAGGLAATVPTLRPLEQLKPYLGEGRQLADLDGRCGSNRAAGPPKIEADHDYAAICAWLALWPAGSPTFRAYRKEAERFLLWCLLVRGKAFSSLTPADISGYLSFLRHVPPHWCGPVRPHHAPDWKPFRGPLSERSIRQTQTILASLYRWLVSQRYLDSNPFEALPRHYHTARLRTDRALSQAQWQFVLDYGQQQLTCAGTPEARRNALRLRFALKFAYLTGLRLAELAAATLGDVETVVRPEGPQLWLRVTGKGKRLRRVPLPPALLLDLKAYLAARGFNVQQDFLSAAPPETPFLATIRKKTVVTESGFAQTETKLSPLALHLMFRNFFKQAGDELAKIDPCAGKRLREATTHWLRHTHGSHAVDKGVPLTVVRDNLGHASLQTTSLYVHKDLDERFMEIEKLA